MHAIAALPGLADLTRTVDPDGSDTDYDYYVWDIRYIDAAVLRWYDDDTDGTNATTLFYCTDAPARLSAMLVGSSFWHDRACRPQSTWARACLPHVRLRPSSPGSKT